MARNFGKEGYSVAEVSQVLHVTPATLRSWIDAGKIEANMSSDKIESGHRRTIRITREQLSRFIMCNQRKYPLDQYKAYVLASHAEEAESKPVATPETQDDATFMISINGRVALGNLGKETCGIIFSALASDSHFQFDELTIKRTKGGAK